MPSSCSRGIASFQVAIYCDKSLKELVKRTTTQQLVCHCRRECSLEPMDNEKQPLEHSTPANEEINKHTEKENSASAFVNQAAIAWHESRRKWTGDQARRAQRTTKDPVIRGYVWAVCGAINFMCPITSEIGSTLWCMDGLQPQNICWSTTYEDLLSTNERFLEPIPLPEMVDFLVDIWHDEGLFD